MTFTAAQAVSTCPPGQGFIRRRIVDPILRLLGSGVSPERLAWSLAIGIVIGISPLLGFTTILMVLVAAVLRLNHPASQLGQHCMAPLQLLLFLPFLRGGAALFHSRRMPFTRAEILHLSHKHPIALLHLIGKWEEHALVLWAIFAVTLTPTFAYLLCRLLTRALKHGQVLQALSPSVHVDHTTTGVFANPASPNTSR